ECAEPEMGFTDAVRKVFRNIPEGRRYLDPKSVRDILKEEGFPLEKYTNPLASIHTILKRLVKKGEINRMVNEDGIRYDAKQRPDPFQEQMVRKVTAKILAEHAGKKK